LDRRFKYLIDKHGDEGARSKFEKLCAHLIGAMYGNSHQVKANPGDGGIDIYVGDLTTKATVFQCKFLTCFQDTQKQNITRSFNTCLRTFSSNKWSLSSWILCVPLVFTLTEHTWWNNWKNKLQPASIRIDHWDENKLLQELRNVNLYDEYFNTVRVDKEFVDKLISSNQKNEINEDFRWIISYICQNDFTYNALDAISSIEFLSNKYEADMFFLDSPLIKLMKDLSEIVCAHAYNGVVSRKEAIDEINTLRREIVEEYKRLMPK